MKKTKQVSNSLFWLKHVLLALTIIAIAGIVLVMQLSRESVVLPEGSTIKKTISSNMSNFYADYRLSSRHPREEGAPKRRNEIPNLSLSLSLSLSRRVRSPSFRKRRPE